MNARRHLTGISSLADAEIEQLLRRAQSFADDLDIKPFYSDLLRGRTVMGLFFENSTRTRVSFEMAAKKLGADFITVDLERSSLAKGETLMDTIANLDAMGPDALVIRHSEYGAPDYIARHVACSVINAGDSWREHPTQALLDALTIRQAKGRIESLRIAIVGDVSHSRVAASGMQLFTRLGAHVRIVAPPNLMPQKIPDGIETFTALADGIAGCDIVMTLRLQKERMQEGLIDSDAQYARDYGLSHDSLRAAKKDTMVMHPGPLNRGIEITDDLADDTERSLILRQTKNGVAVRMAVFDWLLRENDNND